MKQLLIALIAKHRIHGAASCGPDCCCYELMHELDLEEEIRKTIKRGREELVA